MRLLIAAGHDRVSRDPVVADMMNCVYRDSQPLELRTRRRFLDQVQVEHDHQATPYFCATVQRLHSDVAPQEAAQIARGKQHYTLFPEAAGIQLNQLPVQQAHHHDQLQGDQYSCLTHEMVDRLSGQAYDSQADDVLFLCSGRGSAAGTTVSTGSTRLSLHPAAAVVRERGGSQQHRIQAVAAGMAMLTI